MGQAKKAKKKPRRGAARRQSRNLQKMMLMKEDAVVKRLKVAFIREPSHSFSLVSKSFVTMLTSPQRQSIRVLDSAAGTWLTKTAVVCNIANS